MTELLIIITVVSLLVPVYVYVGYPVLLMLLDKMMAGKLIHRGEIRPTVTFIVSCYNEADIIEQKIENCLSIDYPEDKIEFIFVSDGSDDGTDEIIKDYPGSNIVLVRQEGRLGKTMGLNLAMKEAKNEIIVFSDANAMYKKDAIDMLVRNFNDDTVGYVVGAAIYRDEDQSSAGSSEDVYWRYEIYLKNIESRLHSVVGGDGAIYAIRKELYEPLDREDINDFVNPLQIIAKGYRGVFDSDAICYEQTAGDFDKEGRRKQRIVNRSFSGLLRNRTVMNPFRFGFYSLELISHKLLRWLIPFFLVVAGMGITVLAFMDFYVFKLLLLAGIVFVWSIMLGMMLRKWPSMPMIMLLPYYFYLVNLNSMKGVMQALRGDVQVTWNTPRDQKDGSAVIGIYHLLITMGLFLASVWLFYSTCQSLG